MEKSGKGLCSSFDLYHEIIKHAIDLKLYELYPALIHKITKDKFNSREIFDSLDVIARSIIENKQESFYPEIHKIFEYFMPFNQGPTGQSFYSLIMLIISKKVKPLYPLVKKYLPILRSDYNIPIITLIIQEKLSSLYWVSEFTLKKDLDEIHSYYKRYPEAQRTDQSAARTEKLISETLKQLEALKRQ